jgi:hypothetical protein
MTVVIGAICRDAKAVVLAADRTITAASAESEWLSYPKPDAKIDVLSPSVAVAFAGRLECGDPIVEHVKRTAESTNLIVIADKISNVHENARREKLDFYLGRLPNEERLRISSLKPEAQIRAHNGILKEHGWDLTFLIGGLDENGPHLWTLQTSSDRIVKTRKDL